MWFMTKNLLDAFRSFSPIINFNNKNNYGECSSNSLGSRNGPVRHKTFIIKINTGSVSIYMHEDVTFGYCTNQNYHTYYFLILLLVFNQQ